MPPAILMGYGPVSYTHLDVYKRQGLIGGAALKVADFKGIIDAFN